MESRSGDDKVRYAVMVPMPGDPGMYYEVALCTSPESASEIVRVLLAVPRDYLYSVTVERRVSL